MSQRLYYKHGSDASVLFNDITMVRNTRERQVEQRYLHRSQQVEIAFKGTENGKVSREFRDYDTGALYQAQEKAWCDEQVMLYWVNNVLRPYIEAMPNIPENPIRPVLLLDCYSCHLMPSIRAPIAKMGIDLIHIPGGCTSLAQPLDVGYNKPFKNLMKTKFEYWKDND